MSVIWPSDTGSRINELRFSESVSLSFKTRLTSVFCFCGVDFKHGTRDGKHVDVTSRNVALWQTFPQFSVLKTKTGFNFRKNVRKKASNKHIIIIVT